MSGVRRRRSSTGWMAVPSAPSRFPLGPFERGVGGRPTLVLNVETLAHLALVARYGDAWFRSLGPSHAPGTTLMTVTGAVANGGVAEVAMGSSVNAVVEACDPHSQPAMVLAGGYFGGWIPWESCAGLRVDPHQLRKSGAGLGAGILIAAPESTCVIAETARIVSYLAGESAGQCGPCFNGVAAVADDLVRLCSRPTGGRRHGAAALAHQHHRRTRCVRPPGRRPPAGCKRARRLP